MFEKRVALFVLEFPCGTFPIDKFANGFGRLGETEAGKITNHVTDEFKLGSSKITAREGNFRWQYDSFPLLLSLPYLKAKGMFRENALRLKYLMSPAPRRYWMIRIAGINRRSIGARPQAR
jgi:hypothetical protein